MITDQEVYNFVKGDATEKELENYQACFVKNGSPKELEKLKWIHQQNIGNRNMIYYAIEKTSGNVVGVIGAFPVPFRINSIILPAMQTIDAMTDFNHRGKGLLIKLARQLFDEAEKNNFQLVFGFPNANSASGFFKKLDWVSFGEAPFLIKPLRLSYFLRKLLKKKIPSVKKNISIQFSAPAKAVNNGYTIKSFENFEEDYDVLWHAVSSQIKIAANRSSEYMNWRYVQKPGENYYKYGLYIKNKLSGIIVFTLKDKHDGLVGYIMELIYLPGNLNYGKKLLHFATNVLKTQKADVILAWCIKNSFNYKAYKGNYYFPFPPRFRPQKLFFGVKALNKKHQEFIYNLDNWYISYSDSDTV